MFANKYSLALAFSVAPVLAAAQPQHPSFRLPALINCQIGSSTYLITGLRWVANSSESVVGEVTVPGAYPQGAYTQSLFGSVKLNRGSVRYRLTAGGFPWPDYTIEVLFGFGEFGLGERTSRAVTFNRHNSHAEGDVWTTDGNFWGTRKPKITCTQR